MYKKNELTLLRSKFWTSFGKYMDPIPSYLGIRTNWMNYKTGIKHLYFRMDVDKDSATIGIELTHTDEGLRALFYEQFQEFRLLLEQALGEKWQWETLRYDESGNAMSRIYIELTGYSFYNEADWGTLFSFLKKRIMALDEFWSDAFDIFKDLES